MASIEYEAADRIATIRFNRPDVLNAVNEEMLVGLLGALRNAEADDGVRAVIFTGAGRGFCAGAELQPLPNGPAPDAGDTLRRLYHPVVGAMRAMAKPVVVAVNGVAAGAGLSLALAGDVVLAASDASFCAAFSRIGLVPDAGCTYFVPRLAGEMNARAIFLLADRLSAQEAHRLGMVWKVVPPEELQREALCLARQLAQRPPRALALIKQAVAQSAVNGFDDQMEVEARLQSIAARTQDFAEGVAAFLAKREPAYTGR